MATTSGRGDPCQSKLAFRLDPGPRPAQHDLQDESKLKACGTPLPLIELKITDEQVNELLDGEIGEFRMRSPATFTSYRNQPEATAAVLQRGWYRTGGAGFRDKKDGLFYIASTGSRT